MRCDIVVIGASLGGFEALKVVLGGLPLDFPAPVAVVQHQSDASPTELLSLLRRYTDLPLVEPNDKQALVPAHVYLAPVGYHLLVDEGQVHLSTEAPVLHARPSIDALFESAAEAYGPRAVAVVLTSSSRDGVSGALSIKLHGGTVLVQEPSTAEAPLLPRAVIDEVVVDRVLPLAAIPDYLKTIARRF